MQKLFLAALFATGTIVGRGEDARPPLPEGQSELAVVMQQAGLTPERCYLKAEFIHGGSAKLALYPADGFKYDWNFTNGTLCGINEHSSGLEAFTNQGGCLSFKVALPDAFFGWGDVSLGEPQIKLGNDSLNVARSGMRLRGFRVRLKQSLPESSWSIAVRRNHCLDGFASDVEFLKPITITSQEWQTVFFEVPVSRRKGFLFYSGVRFITHTPGNQVQIASVEPCVKEYHPVFRKDFELTSGVRWAKCSIQAGLNFTVHVNGQLAVESKANHSYMQSGLWNYELPARLFQKGRNAIVVDTTSGSDGGGVNRLLFDAALLCENGDYLRLDSDGSWKVAENVAPAQFRSEADTNTWRKVGVTSNTAADSISRAYWFNPSWKGLLAIKPADGRCQPIYTSKEDITLQIAVPVRPGKAPAVAYALYDEMGDSYIAADTLVKKGALTLNPSGADQAAQFQAKAGELPPNKAYALEVTLAENGAEAEKYRYEFAICGPVIQPVVQNPENYTDGMELKLVDEIDAAAEPRAGEFVACIADRTKSKHDVKEAPSSVVQTPLGKFRRPPEPGGYVSWKFRIKNPARPHVIIAEYPDDTTRCQAMWITAAPTENGGGPFYPDNQCANDTVMLGGENPLTQTIKQHHAIFFPVGKLYTASFATIAGSGPWHSDRAAKVGTIKVYEIQNDVPMVKINDVPGSRRWLGQRLEPGPRVVMQSCFSSPLASRFRRAFILNETPNYYRNWLLTYINLVKRMRFAGDNCIGYGVYMYQGVLYPSDTFRISANGTFGSFKDSMTLMAKLFEENDLGLYAGAEITGFAQQTIKYTDTEVAQGADSSAQIDRFGHQQLGMVGTLNPNWLHPETEKYLNTFIDEILQLYGKHKAFKGIIIHTVAGASWGITWVGNEKDPYLTGYGDYTVGRFEKETGVEIPVPRDDPARFAKRYDWLMANAKDQWIQWRQDKLTGVYSKIGQRLKAARDDLQVVAHLYVRGYIEKSVAEAPAAPAEALGAFTPYGLDIKALQADKNVLFIRDVFCDAPAGRYLEGTRGEGRARAHHPNYTTIYANDGKNGVAVRYSWYEYQLYSPKGWPMVYSGLESWPVPGSDFFADYYANVFMRMNPSLIFFSIVDCALWNGRETDQARFAQAYRSLPNGLYQRLAGQGLDKNIWVELCQYGEALYGYVANPQYWNMEVTLQFAEGASKTDLINAQAIKGNEWKIALAPYQIKTFKIAGSKDLAVVKGAETIISKTGRQYYGLKFSDFTNQVARARASLHQRGRLEEAEKLIQFCQARTADNDWNAAAEALGTTLLWNDLLEIAWVPEHEIKSTLFPAAAGQIDLARNPQDWGGAPLFTLNNERQLRLLKAPWGGDKDLAVNAYARWDQEKLYLGFRVFDNELAPRANSGDSIEVYLDADRQGDYGRNVYDTDDFNFKLVPPAGNAAKAECVVFQGTPTGAKKPGEAAGIEVSGRKLDDGYFVSAAIPWAGVKVKARAGLELGFDIMVLDNDAGDFKHAMGWSAPNEAIFSNPRVMGKAILGATNAVPGPVTAAEPEVRKLYAAGQYAAAYAAAISNQSADALQFLYGADLKAGKERFFEFTDTAAWDYALFLRNLMFAELNPIPARGLADALKVAGKPDLESGQPGPAFYGYLTLVKDAENRGDLKRQQALLVQALLAGQLMSTLAPEACKLARIYEKQADLKNALGFWTLAWCMERERQRKGLFENITEAIGRVLNQMALGPQAAEWSAWSAKPTAGRVFPLYDTYSFPPEWTRALEAKLTGFNRSDARRTFYYGQMLFQIGRVPEAIQIRNRVLSLGGPEDFLKMVARDTANYEKWQKAFPRGV